MSHFDVSCIVCGEFKLDSSFRYIRARKSASYYKAYNSTSVISMSMHGSNLDILFGAIRNTLLMKLYYPKWKMRIFISNSKEEHIVPSSVLQKLQILGAEIVTVNSNIAQLPPYCWKYLIADDPSVSIFLVRDAVARLNAREASAVNAWLRHASSRGFHCMRDHQNHKQHSIVDGLWGGTGNYIRGQLKTSMESFLLNFYAHEHDPDNQTMQIFLNETLWQNVKHEAMCHDSVSGNDWPSCVPFPSERVGTEYVGAHYNYFGLPITVPLALIN